jgi:O-antigen/teichoic acid export membrane protein
MSVARSGVAWMLSRFGALGLSLLASMYFTRALADPRVVLGEFRFLETIVSLVVIVSISGLGSALTKRISEGENQSAYLGSALALGLGVLTVVSLVILAASGVVASYFEVGLVAVPLVLALAWTKVLRNLFQAALKGLSRVGRAGALSFVELFVRSALGIALVTVGWQFFGLVGGAIAGLVVSTALTVYIIPLRVGRPSLDRVRSLLSFVKYSFFQGIAGRLYDNVDIIVIQTVLGSAATGVYSVAFRFTLALSIFSGSISQASLPEISKHATAGNVDRVEEVFTDAVVFSTVLAVPAVVGMALLAEPILVTLFGGQFFNAEYAPLGATVAVIAIAIQIPDGMRSVFSSVVNGLDRPDITLRADLALIAVNAGLDILLVPTVGIAGAAVASLVGITVSAAYMGYRLFDVLDLPASVFPVRPLVGEVGAALFMGGCVYWLREAIHLPQLYEIAVLVPAGVVAYGVAVMVVSRAIRERMWGILADVLADVPGLDT